MNRLTILLISVAVGLAGALASAGDPKVKDKWFAMPGYLRMAFRELMGLLFGDEDDEGKHREKRQAR